MGITCATDTHLLVQNSQEVNLIHQDSNRHSNCRDNQNAKVPFNSCTPESLFSDITLLMPENRPLLYRSLSKIEHQEDVKKDRDVRNAVDGQQFIFILRCPLLKIQTTKTGIVKQLVRLLKFLQQEIGTLLIFLFLFLPNYELESTQSNPIRTYKEQNKMRKVHIPNITGASL